jgi:phage-related protein
MAVSPSLSGSSVSERARVECIALIELLRLHGHRLRRPHADYLRDEIYELRVKREGINYRMLYFFHGQQAIVVSHGIVKQRAAVPPIEIERAMARKAAFEAAPARHTHEEN